MINNPYIENVRLEQDRAKFRDHFKRWDARMQGDAQLAKWEYDRSAWRRFMGSTGGMWSWVLTWQQRWRFMHSGNPMRDYPEDMRPFLCEDSYNYQLGFDLNAEFDRVWAETYGLTLTAASHAEGGKGEGS